VATIALHVSGLTCRWSVRSLPAGLRDLSGVQTVRADSGTGTVVVEGEVSEQQVRAVLSGIGLVVTGRTS
jgi:copper chaperone CopZ